jgi:hypothetical protein
LFADRYRQGPVGAIFAQLREEGPALRSALQENLRHIEGLGWLADTVGLLCLLSLAVRVRQLRLEALHVLANLGILLIWPFPEEAARLLWVILPLLLAQPLLWVLAAAPGHARDVRTRLFASAGAVVMLILLLPALAFGVSRWRAAAASPIPAARAYVDWYQLNPDFAVFDVGFEISVIDLLQRAQELVPARDCVMAARPDLVNYYARRWSYLLPESRIPDQRFEQQLRSPGCHYVFVYNASDRRYPDSMYPAARMAGFADVILEGHLPDARPGDRTVAQLWKLR